MNSVLKFSAFIFLIFLIGCLEKKVKQTKVELSSINDSTTIIFDRDSVRIYFGKTDLIEYCKKSSKASLYEKKNYSIKTPKGDTVVDFKWNSPEVFLFRGDTIDIENRRFKSALYKSKDTTINIKVTIDTIIDTIKDNRFILLSYLYSLKHTIVTIKDSMVTKVDTMDKGLFNISSDRGDTIVSVPDWSVNQTQFSEALKWATLDILRAGKGKVFDAIENKFVDYIVIKDLEDNLSGDVEMYLPNGKMFYREMLWIH